MTKEMIVYNCFNGGVISDDLNARFELPIYKTSLSDSKNMVSNFTGVLKNRTGFERVDNLQRTTHKQILKEFKFSQEQSYLMVFDGKIDDCINFYTYDANGNFGRVLRFDKAGENIELPVFTSNSQDGYEIAPNTYTDLYTALQNSPKEGKYGYKRDINGFYSSIKKLENRESYLYTLVEGVLNDVYFDITFPEPVWIDKVSCTTPPDCDPFVGGIRSFSLYYDNTGYNLVHRFDNVFPVIAENPETPESRNWYDVPKEYVFAKKWRIQVNEFVNDRRTTGNTNLSFVNMLFDFKVKKAPDGFDESLATYDNNVPDFYVSFKNWLSFENNRKYPSFAQNGDAMVICRGENNITILKRTSATTFTFERYDVNGLPEGWGMPRACAFWGGRLWLAGFEKTPQGICASEVGNYENFTLTTENIKDTDPLQLIANDLEERIFWLIPGNDVLNAGSHEGVAAIKGAEGVVSPTGQASAKCTKTSDKGSREVNPITRDNFVFYASQDGRHLYSYIYDLLSEAYNVQDKNIISKETTTGIIKRIVYKRDDNDLIYILLENGKMLAYSFNKDENINGFYPIETYGFIEDIECVTRPDGKNDLFAIITDDEARRFLCRLTDEVEFTKFSDKEIKENHRKCVSIWNNELRKANYLDNSIYYSEPHKETIRISNKNVYLPNPQAGFIHDLTNLEIVDNHLKIKDGKSINVAFPCDNAKGYKNIVIDSIGGLNEVDIETQFIYLILKAPEPINEYMLVSVKKEDLIVVDSENDIPGHLTGKYYYCKKENKIIGNQEGGEYSFPIYAFVNELKTVVDNGQEKFEENIAYEQGILNNCNYFEIPQDIYLLDFAETTGAEVVGMEGKHLYAHQDGQDYYYEIVKQVNDINAIYDEKVIEDSSYKPGGGGTGGGSGSLEDGWVQLTDEDGIEVLQDNGDVIGIRYPCNEINRVLMAICWTDGFDLVVKANLSNAIDQTIKETYVGGDKYSLNDNYPGDRYPGPYDDDPMGTFRNNRVYLQDDPPIQMTPGDFNISALNWCCNNINTTITNSDSWFNNLLFEDVLFNIDEKLDSSKLPDLIEITIRATWYKYGTVGNNPIFIRMRACKSESVSSKYKRMFFIRDKITKEYMFDGLEYKDIITKKVSTQGTFEDGNFTTIAKAYYNRKTKIFCLVADGYENYVDTNPKVNILKTSSPIAKIASVEKTETYSMKGYALARLCSDRPINKLENWYLSFDRITGITDFGDSCTVVGDGVNLGELPVNEGYIALPRYCFTAIIGKTYDTYANTMFIGNGIDQIYNKNVYRMTVRLKNTVGGKIGVDPLHLHAFQQIKQDSYLDLQYIMTSDIDIRPDDESKELKKLYMIQDIPLPFQINMVMLETEARRL